MLTKTFRSQSSRHFAPAVTTSFGPGLVAPDGKTLSFWIWAESEGRIVLTLDKDFWQIAVQRRIPLEQSGVALFRVHPATPENIMPLVRAFVEANREWAGHISIIAVDGIQMLAAQRN